MDPSDSAESGRSRREVLRGFAAGAAGIGAAGAAGAAAAAPATPTVLTQNLYLGLKLARLFRARSAAHFRRIVGEFLAEIDPATYRARADAVAGEIVAADADVVALQEAVVLRRQEPGDFDTLGAHPAEEVIVDLLAEVEAALERRGAAYRTAAVSTASDADLPAATDDGPVDLRITDRDVLLVREDVDVERTETDTFETDLTLRVPNSERTVSLCRGYARADLSIGGVPVTAVSTHLEAASSFLRRLQARELLRALPSDGPVVLGGDLNSGPGGPDATYDLLLESFDDAFETVYPHAAGNTCCRPADLRGDARLGRRIDAVLYRGGIVPTDAGRVNHRRNDRVTVDDDDRSDDDDGGGNGNGNGGDSEGSGEGDRDRGIWPSDHAGVVASFELRGASGQ